LISRLSEQSLTIIIPYYKLRYLDAALASLAAQSRQGFRVFIGDDASPEDPCALMRKYEGVLDIRYHRFNENLGRTSLVKQWERCVRETDTEWIWLFSDDDVAEPECIESFFVTVEKTQGRYSVYRFNTVMIDGNDAIIGHLPHHPQFESVRDFAVAKASFERFSFAVEHIFRRSAFDEAGGFIEFPLAWCSDDASWIVFGESSGLCTMETAKVLWRKSGLNLSSPIPELVSQKLSAFRLYLVWLTNKFPDSSFHQRLKSGVVKKFPDHVPYWGGPPNLLEGLRFWLFFVKFTGRLNLRLLRTFVWRLH
jgi:glycosyltransferase involved in cell wall biosynthesis